MIVRTRLKNISQDEIQEYLQDAKDSMLMFCESTEYYGVFDFFSGNLMGFFGVIVYENKIIYKNDYVLQKYRRKGIHSKMMKYRLMMFRAKKTHEATCTEMSYNSYIKQGFRPIKKFKNGCIKVSKTMY